MTVLAYIIGIWIAASIATVIGWNIAKAIISNVEETTT